MGACVIITSVERSTGASASGPRQQIFTVLDYLFISQFLKDNAGQTYLFVLIKSFIPIIYLFIYLHVIVYLPVY